MNQIKILKGLFERTRFFLCVGVAVLTLANCGGAAAPSSSIPLPSVTVGTDIQIPTSSNSSLNALKKLTPGGLPLWAVAETPIADGSLATIHNLSRPVEAGNNLIGAVVVASGRAEFSLETSLVQDGDLLLIKAGSNMWQVFRYSNTGNASLVEADPTNLATTLSYQNLKNYWTTNSVDTSTLTSIDVSSAEHTALGLDETCFSKFLQEAFKSGVTTRGIGGQIGVVRSLFAAALIDENISYSTVLSEYFSTGAWSASTASSLTSSLATVLGHADSTALDRLWQAGANASKSLATLLSGTIAKEGTTNTFCTAMVADDAGTFTSNVVDGMTSVQSYVAFNQTFGTTGKLDFLMDVMDGYQNSETSAWSFTDNFDDVALGTLLERFQSSGNDADFTATTVTSMLDYLPDSGTTTDYSDDFYNSWAKVMHATFEDVAADNDTFDSETASVYWSMQMLGGGLELGDNYEDVNYDTLYDSFETQYNGATGLGNATFEQCLIDATACKDLYDEGTVVINETELTYETTSIGGDNDSDYTCGDLVCNTAGGEDADNCPIDCYDDSSDLCGDAVCDTNEVDVCDIDCGTGNDAAASGVTVNLNGYYSIDDVNSSCRTDWNTNSSFVHLGLVGVVGSDNDYTINTYSNLGIVLFSNTTCHASDLMTSESSSSCTISGSGEIGTKIHILIDSGSCALIYEKKSQQ